MIVSDFHELSAIRLKFSKRLNVRMQAFEKMLPYFNK